ncbi:MAG TPA: secretin N-terminal domain-containing protein [Verrucomicrobiae bacterium]|nr:secretin N-terminal domain-containing protein [Verrucomicrobiae bacterium]
MKTCIAQRFIIAGALAAWMALAGHAADAPDTAAIPAPEPPATAPAAAPAAKALPPLENGMLRLNFRGVPLDMVLDYLSEAAGFIIVKEVDVKGKVDVWSAQPLSKDEAVDVLNTILNKNEYAAIRNGRVLNIVSREEAKKKDIPVKKTADVQEIHKSDGMVTQIIPVRYANVTQLITNLRPLIGTYAEMSANESANSIVLTATETDVRRMTEIISALDDSISSTSGLRVFALKFADAKELAAVIKELFTPTAQQGNNNNRGGGIGGFPGGGFPGFGGGFGGNRGGGGGRGGNSNGATAPHVVAVADERSNSLIVAAPDDILAAIKENIVDKVDVEVSDVTVLRVFQLRNADPQELADMLTNLFPDETKTGNNNNQGPIRFGGFFGQNNRNRAGAQNTSERAQKQGRVIAVPDARTSSLIVSAAGELMPQIAQMINQLDGSQARKQRVYVYSLENADVQEVEQILQEMFQRNTTSMNRNTANQNSALMSRIQQNNQAISTGTQNNGFNSGFGGGNGIGQGLR